MDGHLREALVDTYEAARQQVGPATGMQTYVFSRTLRQDDCADVTVSADPAAVVPRLKAAPGRDIWLFGGGSLFKSLLELGLVDRIQVAVVPVVLGGESRSCLRPRPA